MGRITFKQYLFISIVFLFFQNCGQMTSNLEKQVGARSTASTALLVTINQPQAGGHFNGEAEVTGECTPGFDVELSGDIQSVVTVRCDQGSFVANVTFSSLDGLKTIRAEQSSADEVSPIAEVDVVNDTEQPRLSLLIPVSNTNASSTVITRGLCETGLSVNLQVAGQAFVAPCQNGEFSTSLPLSGADGVQQIEIWQEDLAKNRAATNVQIIKDTQAPTVNVSSPAQNANVSSSIQIRGVCESNLPVDILGAGLASSTQGVCQNGQYDIMVVLTSGSGLKTFEVSQTDLAGNKTAINRQVRRATPTVPAPSVAISSPAIGSFLTQRTFGLSGSCESGLTVNLSGSGHQSPKTTNCLNGSFNVQVQVTAGDGPKTIVVSQTNNSNSTGADSRNFLLDSTNPLVTITQPGSSATNLNPIQLAGSCEEGFSVQITGAGVQTSKNINCEMGGSYSTSLHLTMGDGRKGILVSQVDLAGNRGQSSVTIDLDQTGPQLSITAPAAGTKDENGITIEGNCEGNTIVSIGGSGIKNTSNANCNGGLFSQAILFSSGSGVKTITVTQRDSLGNQSTVSRSFERLAPVLTLYGAFQKAIDNNCVACHGSPSSPYPGIANFAQFSSEVEWSQSSFISPGDPDQSSIYTRLKFSGNGQSNNMPFAIPGVPDKMTLAEANSIKSFIESLNPPGGGGAGGGGSFITSVPLPPVSAAAKVKMVLHGGALTPQELGGIAGGNQLSSSELKTSIDQWVASSAGQEKLKNFFTFAFQQENVEYQDNWLFGRVVGAASRSHFYRWMDNIEESFARTALDIVNNNRPFTEVATTRRHAVTTALLVSYSFADNPDMSIKDPGSRAPMGQFLADQLTGTNPRILEYSDFEDWRMVNLTQASSNLASTYYRDVASIRSVPNNGNYPLGLPRVGYFNTLAFQMRWQTNVDNQFRGPTNQTLIVGLSKTFEAGDLTPHGNLGALDPVHAPQSTSCFQCHRQMDPMRDVFRSAYNYGHRDNFDTRSITSAQPMAGAPQGSHFSFQGLNRQISTVDDLGRAIADHPLFAQGWVQKMCMWANSIPCQENDPEFLSVAARFKNSNFNFKTLLKEFFTSSLAVNKISSAPGAQPFVSVARSSHFCQAVKNRADALLSSFGRGPINRDFCGGAALDSMPTDATPRGAVKFAQSPNITSFSYRAIESTCEGLARQTAGYAPTSSSSERSASIEKIISTIMGMPQGHPRRVAAIAKANEIYNHALSLGLSARDSMGEVVIFSCVSPELLGVGL